MLRRIVMLHGCHMTSSREWHRTIKLEIKAVFNFVKTFLSVR